MTRGGEPVENFNDVWHVARVECGKERAFVSDLLRYDQPFFIPWQIKRTKYQNRVVRVSQEAPFKGYCFLSGEDAVDIARQRCRGYLTVMRDLRGERSQNSIRADVFKLYHFYINDPDVKAPVLGRGVLVKVTDKDNGLYGVVGRVISHETGKRLTIDINIFSRSVAVDIENDLAVEVLDS